MQTTVLTRAQNTAALFAWRGIVAIALFASIVGTACGQGFRLTKPAFIKRTDATCLQFLKTVDPLLAQIFGKERPDMRAAAAVQTRVVSGIRTMLDERDALRPPAKDQRTIDAINGIERRTFERFIPAFEKAATARDADALNAAFQAADAGFGPGTTPSARTAFGCAARRPKVSKRAP